MSAFHDVLFPLSVGLGARGGPERFTEIVELASGHEERNSPWAHSRRRWDAGPGVRSADDLALLTAFFEARRGRLHAFRFRDPADHASCLPSAQVSASDQLLGLGDGERTRFPLIKRYGEGEGAYVRPITLPASGSVQVAVNGAAEGFTLDGADIVLDEAAPDGAGVSAGFRFDVPVRFDTDRLEIALDAFRSGAVLSVPLVEVRLC